MINEENIAACVENFTEYLRVKKTLEKFPYIANYLPEMFRTSPLLSTREQKVIEMRFGADPCTLDEVGKEFCVTRERIRTIELKALRKMNNYCLKKEAKLLTKQRLIAEMDRLRSERKLTDSSALILLLEYLGDKAINNAYFHRDLPE